VKWLEATLEDEPTLERHFARAMARLLGEQGLVLVAPRLPELRGLARDVIRFEIEQPGESTRTVINAEAALSKASYDAPLHRRPEDVNFFLERDGWRCKVTHEDGAFIVQKPDREGELDRHSSEQILTLLDENPEAFSPNVVTRPIVQDRIFPTLAYIGGPGEIAYHAQLRGVYEGAKIFQPVIWPRPRAALIEPRVRRSAEKIDLDLQAFYERPIDEWREHTLARSPSRDAIKAIEAARSDIGDRMCELSNIVSPVSTGSADATDKTADNIRQALDRLDARIRKEIANNDATLRHFEKISVALLPGGVPQERALSALIPWLINYDRRFIDTLLDRLLVDSIDKQSIYL
jgi:bacillithiol biosynthesis cysteine-adding enzyme BshC